MLAVCTCLLFANTNMCQFCQGKTTKTLGHSGPLARPTSFPMAKRPCVEKSSTDAWKIWKSRLSSVNFSRCGYCSSDRTLSWHVMTWVKWVERKTSISVASNPLRMQTLRSWHDSTGFFALANSETQWRSPHGQVSTSYVFPVVPHVTSHIIA